MNENITILVTGGAGFIGSNLVRRLAGEGARVRATLHYSPVEEPTDGVEYVQADLLNPDDCKRVCIGISAVFMCAANTQGAAIMTEAPLNHVTPNIIMNSLMLEASYQAGVEKFVFLSSSAAYPDTGATPVSEEEMFNDNPSDVYYHVGWMKRYTEILCEAYSSRVEPPMNCLVVRPSNIYGPGDDFDPETSHVTAALIRRVALRQNPMEIWGTGEDIRDIIYIDDFLNGLLAAFAIDLPYLEINICKGEGVSVKQILETAMEVAGYEDVEIFYNASKPTTVPIRLLDPKRAQKLLKFHPKITLREGIRRTMFWYQKNRIP